MKFAARFALSCITALAFSTSASAGVIVDTGTGSVPYGGAGLFAGQWLANSFTISEAQTITGVNGWLGGNRGNLRIGIRSTVNALPGTLLYSATTAPTTGPDNAWVGVSNLDWTLDAGTYFVSFDVPVGGYVFGGGMGQGAANPVGIAAFTDDNGNWRVWSGLALGMQVFGTPAAVSGDVPEPSSFSLSALAIAALVAARRKRA